MTVFGTKWETPDGTGVRDYIHIVDLARGHVMALDRIKREGWLGESQTRILFYVVTFRSRGHGNLQSRYGKRLFGVGDGGCSGESEWQEDSDYGRTTTTRGYRFS